ncbi:flagellin [Nesterenkonia massiliensis]|uniref:Flagellin n=2 Tax=Nesterenkonia massiliensis TaxID=1232429 RepID=A0ABT2HNI7_9MICC|nr:flagellin [Nesterenkonia massiliensis]
MQINTNVAALNAHRNLSNTQNALSSSLEKLSSGLRINRAADDAAGLSISEGLRSQVNGLAVAARNAQDGISVIQTAEGSLSEAHSILQRVRDLTVQAGNDTNNPAAREAIMSEIGQLGDELDRLADNANFNGINLLNGEHNSLTFQIGAGSDASNQISVNLTDLKAVATAIKGLGDPEGQPTIPNPNAGDPGAPATIANPDYVPGSIDAENVLDALADIDEQIANVSSARSDLGASQNRLESAINSINVSRENLSAAESRIRDVDMAAEMVNFTRSNILSQAGTAMLAQANQSTSGVLQLLG